MSQKKDSYFSEMNGTYLPADTLIGKNSYGIGEVIKPLPNGQFYKRPKYLSTSGFRTFGELRRSSWEQ